jgi:hypothetical protein
MSAINAPSLGTLVLVLNRTVFVAVAVDSVPSAALA